MMRVRLERFGHGYDSTLGRLYIPGQEPCFTLEDQRQEGEKVMHETRIPEGEYDLDLRPFGGFHLRYSERYKHIHRGMLWVRDVPGFSAILIHTGNTDADTSGCILVGEAPGITPAGEFTVHRSRSAYTRIYPVLAEYVAEKGHAVLQVVSR